MGLRLHPTPIERRRVERSLSAYYKKINVSSSEFLWFEDPRALSAQVIRDYSTRFPAGMGKPLGRAWTRKFWIPWHSQNRKLGDRFDGLRTVERFAWNHAITAWVDENYERALQTVGMELDGRARYNTKRQAREALMGNIEVPHIAHQDPRTAEYLQQYMIRPLPWATYICKHRAVSLDGQGRLHRGDGPAIRYPNWKVWALEGMEFSEDVVMRPETITTSQVRRERNQERRRILLEQMTLARFMELDKGMVIDESTDPKGFPRRLWRSQNGRALEPMMAVEVTNSTPEPDGTYKTYMLRVPPNIPSAEAGVAWTFDLSVHEYRQIYDQS